MLKITIEGIPKEIAALVLELQERQVYDVKSPFDGVEVTEAVLKAIRDRCSDSTSPSG